MKTGGNNRQEYLNKCWEVAYNFVNLTGGNKTEALKKYYIDHYAPEKITADIRNTAYMFFKNNKILANYIEYFRDENRKELAHLREENIAMLKEIASNVNSPNRDKIAAIKELNAMCGYGAQTLKVESENTITIEIEDED